MKTGYMILSAASLIPLLSGCASYQKTADSEAWSIKPTYNVRHSIETPDSFYQLGRYYQGQNRHEQALAAYRKALAIDGTFAEARNGLGVVYAMQGRQQEALEQFRLAAKHAPNAAHIQNNLGYALYLSGSYAESASALERAVAIDPANQAAHTNLALALDKAGDRGKAVQVMAQAAKPQPAENLPPVTQEAQQVTSTSTPVSPQAVAPVAAPSPAPQQALALPKDWGVITRAVRKQVPQVESRIEAVQLSPNVYELRERTEVKAQAVYVAKPLQQAPVQPMEQGMTAQAVKEALPRADSLILAAQQVQTASPASKPYRVEVSNGNGVTGMAKLVAGFLGEQGYKKARMTNQKTYSVTFSQVRYRQGYLDEAQLLAGKLPGKHDLVQAVDLRKDISVQIVLGKDIARSVAYFGSDGKKVKLARTGADS